MLVDEFRSLSGQDHDPRFRALAVSASVSLFGEDTEAPPITSFEMGYSCGDLSFRGLLTSLLSTCRLDQDLVDDVADGIIQIAGRYGLQTGPYLQSTRGGFYHHPGTPSSSRSPGHILQIFIHRDYVDDVCYAAQPYGVPVQKKEIFSKKLLEGPATGQARVFMHPDLFVGGTRGIIYHYAADQEYALIGREGLHADLSTVLSPIVSDPVALERARLSLKGLPFEE